MKQDLFLTLAGEKPISEVFSSHLEPVPGVDGYFESRPDDPKAVGRFLDELGLTHHLTIDRHTLTAVVSLPEDDVEQYREVEKRGEQLSLATIALEMGRLFGYPETAAQAFADGTLMPGEQQDKVQAKAGLPSGYALFRFSVNHYREELKVMTRWYEILTEYGLI